jgi:methanogenic corrinoid protein MtbC1
MQSSGNVLSPEAIRKFTDLRAEAIAAGNGFCETEMHLMQTALYQIGVLWQENQVTVAQEHLATAICHSIMAGGLPINQFDGVADSVGADAYTTDAASAVGLAESLVAA